MPSETDPGAPPQQFEPSASDGAAAAAAIEFARAVAACCDAQLEDRLRGAYLLGSLAHGGFSRRYSDIDLALILEDDPGSAALDSIRAEAAALSPEQAQKLSLFWTDRQFSIGRFPPLDRVDYLDRGVALLERERVVPVRPPLDEIRSYLRGAPFANWAKNARHYADLDRLAAADRKPYLRALLYPARFIYSWTTGRMASNDDAVAHVAERPPPGLDLDLIERALQCRRTDSDPDELFSARAVLARQVETCARFAGIAW
jgi:predicted nucleotidyltransferase